MLAMLLIGGINSVDEPGLSCGCEVVRLGVGDAE